MVEWIKDDDGDWNLIVNGGYVGLLSNRSTVDHKWRFLYSLCEPNQINTPDLEEAKNIAFALWALNQ